MPSLPSADLLPITKDFLVEIGGWPMLKQAQGLVDTGRVISVTYHAPVLSGRVLVDGRELVSRLKNGRSLSDVENLCTCRQAKMDGSICAHVLAIGLVWIQQRDRAAVSPLRTNSNDSQLTSAPEPVRSASPPVWRCAIGSQPEKSRVLEVRALLPLNWPEVLRGPKLRVILEARMDGGEFRPWDTVTRSGGQLLAVSEEDESLLRWVESQHNGNVPGLFEILSGEYHSFFQAVTDHPRLWIGKKSQIQVRPFTRKPVLMLQGESGGALQLSLRRDAPAAGERFPLRGGFWRWQPATASLEEEFSLPAPYTMLERQTVTIDPPLVANFINKELPALSQLLPVDSDGSLEKIQFVTPAPRIVAVIDGGLPGLSLRLEADYEGERVLLRPGETAAANDSASREWRPFPSRPGEFWSRHGTAETAARREVERAGFSVGHRSPENYFLSGERLVGQFLANVLPRWRRQWRVDFGDRMRNILPRLDYVEPEITLRESGSGNDWLGLDLELRSPSNTTLSPAEVQRWLQTGQSHQRLANDRILLMPTTGWSELQQVLADCAVQQEAGGKIRFDRRFAPYLTGAIESQGWHLSAHSNGPQPPPPLPSLSPGLAARLRPYQQQGCDWLSGLAQRELGGLLADEMGLGKTVQILALLERLHAPAGGKPVAPSLIICPTSLVENWRNEAQRFTPQLRVLILHGADRHERFEQINQHDVVITSYALLRRDLERYLEHKFTAAILDEAQHIKNRGSLNAQSAKAIKAQHHFILTGTPLENSLFDLWSLFDFLMPGYLGTASEFKERYETPIARDRDQAVLDRLRLRIRPFFLRRTKEEVVSDLPAKLEQLSLCDLTAEQQATYQAILNQSRREVFDGSGKSGKGQNRIAVLTALLRLRQTACHLGLLPAGPEPKAWKEPSGKFDLALELLDQAIDGGHRVLVFSQFVQLLQLFRAELETREIRYSYLDGSTVNRAEEVARFQTDDGISVFLISLKAGGVGLNLTGADTVLHLDPWWNPAVEDQATARAHRIGQTRVVNAYKLIARGTVEEKILALQEKKKELISASMTNEALFVESLSWEELRGLFD